MRKLFFLPLLFALASCAGAPFPSEAPQHIGRPGIYTGTITKYLVRQKTGSATLRITFDGTKGTFTTSDGFLFFDSLRAIAVESHVVQGYIYPSNICFDTAFAWAGKNLQAVRFTIEGDSLSGDLPADWAGFRYRFTAMQ